MSQETLHIARKSERAFTQGDWDWFHGVLDPNVLIRLDERWPERCVYGRESVVAFFCQVRETLGGDVEIQDMRDLEDRLLIRYAWKTRGDHSGIENDTGWSQIDTFRDGLLILSEYFLDHRDALSALGLEE